MGNRNHEVGLPKIELKEFFENLPIPAFIVSPSGEVLDINKSGIENLGCNEINIIGKKFLKLYPTEKKFVLKEMFSELIETGFAKERELEILACDKTKRAIVLSADSIRDEKGTPIFYIFMQVDMTGIKQIEKEREKHLFLIQSIRKINDSILKSNDIDHILENALESALSIMNSDRTFLLFPCDPESSTWSIPIVASRPEYPGLNPGDVIPKTSEASAVFQAALKTNEPIIFNSTDNGFIPTEIKTEIKSQMVIAIYPKIGKPWLLAVHQCSYPRIWSGEDANVFKEIGYQITNALNSFLLLKDLRENESKFRSLIQAAPVVIIHLDPNHKILEFNNEAENLYGKKKEDVIGKDYLELFVPEEMHENLSQEISMVLEGKKTRRFENDIIGKGGETRNMSWNSERLLDSKEKIVGIIAIGQDITQRKKSQSELNEKIRQLESMNEKMIGREMKMVELKEEIKKLTQDLKNCLEEKK